MNYDIFISYASADLDRVVDVRQRIEAAGLRCWMAPRDIQPGVSYPKAIVQAIKDCRYMVIVITCNAVQSEAILNEIETAFNEKKNFMALRLEDVPYNDDMAFYLSRKQHFDVFRHYDQEVQIFIERLLENMGRPQPPTIQKPQPTPNPAHIHKVRTPILYLILGMIAIALIASLLLWPKTQSGSDSPIDDNPIEDTLPIPSEVSSSSLPTSTTPMKEPTSRSTVSVSTSDASAMYETGRKYHLALGVERDFTEAARWYQRAADKDYPPAINALGNLYEKGFGVPQDMKKATQLYEKSAELGDKEGQFHWAVVLLNRGTHADSLLALDWLQKSAQQGYAPARNRLK